MATEFRSSSLVVINYDFQIFSYPGRSLSWWKPHAICWFKQRLYFVLAYITSFVQRYVNLQRPKSDCSSSVFASGSSWLCSTSSCCVTLFSPRRFCCSSRCVSAICCWRAKTGGAAMWWAGQPTRATSTHCSGCLRGGVGWIWMVGRLFNDCVWMLLSLFFNCEYCCCCTAIVRFSYCIFHFISCLVVWSIHSTYIQRWSWNDSNATNMTTLFHNSAYLYHIYIYTHITVYIYT